MRSSSAPSRSQVRHQRTRPDNVSTFSASIDAIVVPTTLLRLLQPCHSDSALVGTDVEPRYFSTACWISSGLRSFLDSPRACPPRAVKSFAEAKHALRARSHQRHAPISRGSSPLSARCRGELDKFIACDDGRSPTGRSHRGRRALDPGLASRGGEHGVAHLATPLRHGGCRACRSSARDDVRGLRA